MTRAEACWQEYRTAGTLFQEVMISICVITGGVSLDQLGGVLSAELSNVKVLICLL